MTIIVRKDPEQNTWEKINPNSHKKVYVPSVESKGTCPKNANTSVSTPINSATKNKVLNMQIALHGVQYLHNTPTYLQ